MKRKNTRKAKEEVQEEGEEEEEEEDCETKIDFAVLKPEKIEFPRFLERYTERRFLIQENREDQWICRHHNGVVLVGIAPTHPVCNRQITGGITAINFEPQVEQSKVVGKCHRGGISVSKTTVLCKILTKNCTNGYNIIACIKGDLLEINERLTTDFSLLENKPNTEAYFAIIKPPFGMTEEDIFKGFLTPGGFAEHRAVTLSFLTCDHQK